MSPQEFDAIIAKIAVGEADQAEISALRCALAANELSTQQLGKYNINIGQGQNVQIGDNFYFPELTDEAIQAIAHHISEKLQEQSTTGSISQDDRLTRLQELQRESRVRCIVRWLAVGVGEEMAEEFADNPAIGSIPSSLHLSSSKVILITGGMGIGKSLVAERLFQNSVRLMIEDEHAPIPCYLEAWQWRDERPLQKLVETTVSDLGEPKTQGVIVFINGADEIIGASNDLLSDARLLVKVWPNTTVVITSRPFRNLVAQDVLQETVPELSVNQACKLISQVAGQVITEYIVSQWSPSLRSAIKLPLFALLLANYLKAKDIRVPQSTGELLNNLIDRSLGQEVADRESSNHFLQTLATRCIQYSGPVHPTEVTASRADFQSILSSRLVIEQQGKLGFALPILNEWFAAQSLVAGIPDPELLAQDVEQLESWRYPLIIAIAASGHEQVSRFLTPIVRNHPAFAAEVVTEALASRFIDISHPPWQICGQQVREAMQAWAVGLDQPSQQSLAQLIAPVRQDGMVREIGVRIEAERLTIGWYQGQEKIADVVELLPLPEVKDFSPIRAVNSLRSESVTARWIGPQPAWSWLWTLDELVASLSKLLQRRGLSINYGLLSYEALWKLVRLVLSCSRNNSYRYFSPHLAVPLDILESVLGEFAPTISSFSFSGKTIYREDLNYLAIKAAELRASGRTHLAPPWTVPEPYSVEAFPWRCYTPEQIRTYAEYVYLEALNGYQHTVSTWFPKFADRLKLSVLIPVHLVGAIAYSESDHEPSLYWYFEALPHGESNRVSFSITEESLARTEFFDAGIRERVDNQRHALRPHKMHLIGNTTFYHSGLHLFEPTAATELVYNWLWDDLKQVSWVNGFLGSPPR